MPQKYWNLINPQLLLEGPALTAVTQLFPSSTCRFLQITSFYFISPCSCSHLRFKILLKLTDLWLLFVAVLFLCFFSSSGSANLSRQWGRFWCRLCSQSCSTVRTGNKSNKMHKMIPPLSGKKIPQNWLSWQIHGAV